MDTQILDWKKDASKFVAENVSQSAGLMDGPLQEFLDDVEGKLALPILKLAFATYSHLLYHRDNRDDFLKIGPFWFPANGLGIKCARRIRKMSQRLDVSRVVDPNSPYVRIMDLIEFDPFVSDARYIIHDSSVCLNLTIAPDVLRHLPRIGTRDVVRSITAPAVVGYEFSGSDIESWRQFTDACADGISDFLKTINVDHSTDTEDEIYCDQCGAEHENKESPNEITSCDDFTITESIARLLKKEGYLEATADWILEESGEHDDWESFLELDTSSILERFGPRGDEKDYDPLYWDFEPNLESLDGFDDLETADIASVTLKIAKLLDAYSVASQLPPIPGHFISKGHRKDLRFQWIPEDFTMEHKLGANVSIWHNVKTGKLNLTLETDSHSNAITIEPSGRTADTRGLTAGIDAETWAQMAGSIVSL